MHAIDNGESEVSMQLIKILGAKDIKFLNIQDCEGKTPLMHAIDNGDSEVSMQLIKILGAKDIKFLNIQVAKEKLLCVLLIMVTAKFLKNGIT